MKVVILGAGLSGLTAGYYLKKYGVDCTIYEKESTPGGACRSDYYGSYFLDRGVHVLWGGAKDWIRFVEKELKIPLNHYDRDAVVSYNDRMVPYPFQYNFTDLPREEAYEILRSFVKVRFGSVCDFKTWLINNFGRVMAEKFFIPFNEKFWRCGLDTLDEITSNGIPVPSVDEVLAKIMLGEDKKFKANHTIAYPKDGTINLIPYRMVKGLDVWFNHEVNYIDFQRQTVCFNGGHGSVKYDVLVSSIPMNSFIKMAAIPMQKDSELKSVGVYSTLVVLDTQFSSFQHWIYFPDPKQCFYRVTPMGSISDNRNCLMVETTFDKRVPVKKLHEAITKGLTLWFRGYGIGSENILRMKTIECNPGYVKFDMNYTDSMGKIYGMIPDNVKLIGRYGRWEYSSMHDVYRQGKEVANKIRRMI